MKAECIASSLIRTVRILKERWSANQKGSIKVMFLYLFFNIHFFMKQ